MVSLAHCIFVLYSISSYSTTIMRSMKYAQHVQNVKMSQWYGGAANHWNGRGHNRDRVRGHNRVRIRGYNRGTSPHQLAAQLWEWENGILSYRLIFLKFGLIDYCDTDNNFASLASLRRMRCRRSSTPHCPLGLAQRPCWIVCEISPASHAVSTNTGKFCEIKSKQPLGSTSKRSASSPCTLPRRICRI